MFAYYSKKMPVSFSSVSRVFASMRHRLFAVGSSMQSVSLVFRFVFRIGVLYVCLRFSKTGFCPFRLLP